MIKNRSIYTALRVEYKKAENAPTFNVFIDGVQKVFEMQLPVHPHRTSRRVLLPHGLVGYTAQVTFSNNEVTRFSLESVPIETFTKQQILHYWEVMFEGDVTLKLSLDEIYKKSNNSTESITISTRGDRATDTRRIYYPALSWGYIPALEQTSVSINTGQVHSATPVALMPRFYKGLRSHSEIQLTYQGDVGLDVFMDGELLQRYDFSADDSDENKWVTTKDYLPAGSRGQVLQYIQISGDGEIAMVESDVTLTDLEQPQQSQV